MRPTDHRSWSVIPWALGLAALLGSGPREPVRPAIVQGPTMARAAAAVRDAGAAVTHELGVISAVGAEVTAAQSAALTERGLTVWIDPPAVTTRARPSGEPRLRGRARAEEMHKKRARRGLDTTYPTVVGADKLHAQGIDGSGVTVAFIDTGIWTLGSQIEQGIAEGASGADRIVAQYDALSDRMATGDLATQWIEIASRAVDHNGHGTHVVSVGASSYTVRKPGNRKLYNGIAPDVDLVMVKAFDENGVGSYLDVIRGIDWVVTFKDVFGIRVLNLSFSAPPRSRYWEDPLNQAVMRAWQAGIVVVASAGNQGPDPMTIGVPGNVPYVITVGAMSDAATRSLHDDFLATFSSTGPTAEGFVKPEVVAPGGHILGLMDGGSTIAVEHPEFHDGASYFTMSGTSQAAAIVSGIAALMLEADPTLTPDQVKCRLMASARPAANENLETEELELAYTVFQQGAGLVDSAAAIRSQAEGCANRGLDVALDLSGRAHFVGRGRLDPEEGYYLEGLSGDGYLWSDDFVWSDGTKWHQGYAWSDGYIWSDAFLWSDDFVWSDGYIWSDAFLWSDASGWTAKTHTWVPQE